jgi:hypothetical protein
MASMTLSCTIAGRPSDLASSASAGNKTCRHESSRPAGKPLLEVLLQGDALASLKLLRCDLQTPLEVGIDLLEQIIEVLYAKQNRGGLTALGDNEPRFLLGDLSQDRSELSPRDIRGDGRVIERESFASLPLSR